MQLAHMVIIVGRSMLILGKGFKNYRFYFTPVTPKEPSPVLFTATGTSHPGVFATPDLIEGINKHTNLGQPHKANLIVGLLHTAEQTGPTLSGCVLQLGSSVPASGSTNCNTRGCATMEPRTGPSLTTV